MGTLRKNLPCPHGPDVDDSCCSIKRRFINTNVENHTTFVGSAVEPQIKRGLSNKPLNLTVFPRADVR